MTRPDDAISIEEARLGVMSEKEFQARVIEEAKANNWMVYHTYDSRRSAKGFPDLVMARRPRVIVAELKSDNGRLTREQIEWIHEFTGTPVEAYVWRPKDTDKILATLE